MFRPRAPSPPGRTLQGLIIDASCSCDLVEQHGFMRTLWTRTVSEDWNEHWLESTNLESRSSGSSPSR